MWNIPKIWNGGTCYIIGGGPSIVEQLGIPASVADEVRKKTLPISAYAPYFHKIKGAHTIGINAAYKLGDWLDIVFWGDSSFWKDNEDDLLSLKKALLVTCMRTDAELPRRVKHLKKSAHRYGVCEEKNSVSWNYNSGAAAINLAMHLGARRIILLGFDMSTDTNQNQHWHKEYKNDTSVEQTFARHLRGFPHIQKAALDWGVEIINASPNSAINAFPKMTLKKAMKILPIQHNSPYEKSVSIIITAYNAANTIEKCLDSVFSQDFFKQGVYEVLLGIDSCEKTRRIAEKIKHKYSGLKVLYSPVNVGTYILSNSLAAAAKMDYVVRFDSDDEMYPEMIRTLAEEEKSILRCRYDWKNVSNGSLLNSQLYSCGQVWIKRSILIQAGGWSPWKCGADSDLLARLQTKHRVHRLNEKLFLKWRHDEALTRKKETGMGSPLRQHYQALVREHVKRNVFSIEMETTELIEL